MALTIACGVESNLSFSVASSRDHRDFALGSQHLTKRIGVIAFVCDYVFCLPGSAQEDVSAAYIRDISWRQVKGVGTPDCIGESVDFGRLATARGANRLFFAPPFPPWAQRWAFT